MVSPRATAFSMATVEIFLACSRRDENVDAWTNLARSSSVRIGVSLPFPMPLRLHPFGLVVKWVEIEEKCQFLTSLSDTLWYIAEMRLKKALKMAGKTIGEMSVSSGISFVTLQQIASGRRSCSKRVAERVAEELSCEAVLVGGDFDFRPKGRA